MSEVVKACLEVAKTLLDRASNELNDKRVNFLHGYKLQYCPDEIIEKALKAKEKEKKDNNFNISPDLFYEISLNRELERRKQFGIKVIKT